MTEYMPTRGPAPKVSDDEILDIIRQGNRPFATAPEVASEAGISENRTRQRLAKLAAENSLERFRTGGAWIYWLD